jgi:hypothetical protein
MSGIFPNSGDGGLPPGPDPLNPNHAYDPTTDPLNTAALYYGNGCDVRLRPEVVNSLISEIEGLVDEAEVAYDAGRLTNLELAARYLIQRGKPRAGAMTMATVNQYTVALDPVSTAYNDWMTLSLTPSANNTSAVQVNIDNHGFVALRRNDGAQLQKNDIQANVPMEAIYYQGSLYCVGLVASQVQVEKAAFANGFAVYASRGTYSWTVPDGVTRARVTLWGAGGSGGGAGPNGHGGSGGGGGGYAQKLITGLVPGTVVTITVGAGGYGVLGATYGIAGGTTSFGNHVSATGGAGGLYGSTGTYNAGTGYIGQVANNYAFGFGGNVNLGGNRGQQGGVAWIINVWSIGGAGGAAPMGGGGGPPTTSGGNAGTAPGGGGAGGGGGTASSTYSGAGADGMCIVEWVDPNLP